MHHDSLFDMTVANLSRYSSGKLLETAHVSYSWLHRTTRTRMTIDYLKAWDFIQEGRHWLLRLEALVDRITAIWDAWGCGCNLDELAISNVIYENSQMRCTSLCLITCFVDTAGYRGT